MLWLPLELNVRNSKLAAKSSVQFGRCLKNSTKDFNLNIIFITINSFSSNEADSLPRKPLELPPTSANIAINNREVTL